MNEQQFPNIFEEPHKEPNNFVPPQRQLERSKTDIVIAGVCSGLAEYFKIDAAIVRLFFLLALLLGVWIFAAYFVATFLIPQEIEAQQLSDEDRLKLKKINSRTVAGGLLMLAGLHFAFVSFGLISKENLFSLPSGFMFPFITIAAGAYFLGIKDDGEKKPEILPSKFYRSRSDRLLMGVCGGFARYIGAEPYTVRIVFVLAALLTLGFFVIVYLMFSITLKTDDPEIASH